MLSDANSAELSMFVLSAVFLVLKCFNFRF